MMIVTASRIVNRLVLTIGDETSQTILDETMMIDDELTIDVGRMIGVGMTIDAGMMIGDAMMMIGDGEIEEIQERIDSLPDQGYVYHVSGMAAVQSNQRGV